MDDLPMLIDILMAQRANIPGLSEPQGPSAIIGQQYGTGQPIMANPDGSRSTERGVTVEDGRLYGGRPTNIPSLWGGRELDENSAIIMALLSGRDFPNFGSIPQAVNQSIDHSRRLGGYLSREGY